MREALSKVLVRHGKEDAGMLVLTGDHGYALFDSFRKICPSQYVNAGVAEQNMIGMAAGLAKIGFHPYVYGLSSFIPLRVLEQIKIDLAHDSSPVILIGDGAGLVYSHLGTSHQSTEDIAVTRAIPNLEIFSPCDAFELDACFEAAKKSKTTAYIRVGKADKGDVHKQKIEDWGKGDLIKIRKGSGDMVILATGSMVQTAIKLKEDAFFEVEIWSVPSIKPINKEQILSIASRYESVVTIEEHSVFGGMGSVVAEILSEVCVSKVLRVGVQDRFSDKCGSYEYLLKEHKLDFDGIKKQIYEFRQSLNCK